MSTRCLRIKFAQTAQEDTKTYEEDAEECEEDSKATAHLTYF